MAATRSPVPTSTSIEESALIQAPLSHVWHFIKLQDFSKFWSALKSSETVKGANEETDIVRWTFNDGHVLEVKQEEHSVSRSYVANQKTRLRANLAMQQEDTDSASVRPSTTTSHTRSSPRSPPSATAASSAPCVATPLPAASWPAQLWFNGLGTSPAMPMPVSIPKLSSAGVEADMCSRRDRGRQVQTSRGAGRPGQSCQEVVNADALMADGQDDIHEATSSTRVLELLMACRHAVACIRPRFGRLLRSR